MRGVSLMRGVISPFLGRALRSSSSSLRWVAPYQYCTSSICAKRGEDRLEEEEERELFKKWEEMCKGVSEERRREWTSYELFCHVDYPYLSDYRRGRPLGPVDLLKPKDVLLFQYEKCPLGNKVSAFLDYYEIPYIPVHVTPITKKEIRWSPNKQLPIFVVDGQPTLDSSDLINKLVKRMHPDYDLNTDEEKMWREWVDNYLVDVVSTNTYRTFDEALDAFLYVSPEVFDGLHDGFGEYRGYLPISKRLERLERSVGFYGGAAAMCYASKKLKKKHNIIDERAALNEAVEQWVDALKGRKFLGGWNNPNLADLAVFGVLRSIYYYYSGRDMVEHTRIKTWFNDMQQLVRPFYSLPSRLSCIRSGDFHNEEFAQR